MKYIINGIHYKNVHKSSLWFHLFHLLFIHNNESMTTTAAVTRRKNDVTLCVQASARALPG